MANGRETRGWAAGEEVPTDVVNAVLGLSWLFAAGYRGAHRLLGDGLGPREVWNAAERRLVVWGATPQWARAFVQMRRGVPLAQLWASLRRSGLGVLPQACPGYPVEFRQLKQPPAGLFLAGSHRSLAETLNRPRVTIVGSRHPDSYGLRCATAFAAAFARAGVTVVSGMALGVDGQAHTAALDAGGGSVAVLGSGADTPYPRRHRHLFERLVASGGVLSELPPGTCPARWTFPWRNRLLAALGDALLVVQAGEKSGALSTVDAAVDLGRDVFVVPGRVRDPRHAGCNALLYHGARLALDPDTVVEDFFSGTRNARIESVLSGGRVPDPAVRKEPSLQPVERLVLFAMEAGEGSVEALARATGCGVSEVAAACAVLEVEGRCTRSPAGVYEMTC